MLGQRKGSRVARVVAAPSELRNMGVAFELVGNVREGGPGFRGTAPRAEDDSGAVDFILHGSQTLGAVRPYHRKGPQSLATSCCSPPAQPPKAEGASDGRPFPSRPSDRRSCASDSCPATLTRGCSSN